MKSRECAIAIALLVVLFSPPIPVPAQCVAPPAGMVGWWPGDGHAGDLVGSHNGALANGATFEPGVVDQAFCFDGVNDYVRFGDVLDGVFSGADKKFTIEMWVKVNAMPISGSGQSATLFGKFGDSNQGVQERQFHLHIPWWGTMGQLAFRWHPALTDWQHWKAVRTSSVLPVGQWTHVAMTYDGAIDSRAGLDRVKIYFDGIPQPVWLDYHGDYYTSSAGNIPNGPAQVSLGATVASNNQGFNFANIVVDEVSVYSRLLAASEIGDIFNAGSGGKCKGLPPVADAGTDQSVHPGDTPTLDGSGSSDPDAQYPLAFAWTLTSQPVLSQAVLEDPTTSTPSFLVDEWGEYVVELVVTDSAGLESAPDQVVVSTFNSPPIADAGEDQVIILFGELVQLDGTRSWDPEGDTLYYQWVMEQRPAGSSAELQDASSPTPSFIADVHGDYVIRLTVSDPWDTGDPDPVTVSFENVPPVADAGPNQSVLVHDTAWLNGGGSSDANGDPITYEWALVSKPDDSLMEIADPLEMTASLQPDLPGEYIVSLVVHDGFAASDPDNASVLAISYQDAISDKLMRIVDLVNGLPNDAFKKSNPKVRKKLTSKVLGVLKKVQKGDYKGAHKQLQKDVIEKVDGCVTSGSPDKNDLITDCVGQEQVHDLAQEALTLLGILF